MFAFIKFTNYVDQSSSTNKVSRTLQPKRQHFKVAFAKAWRPICTLKIVRPDMSKVSTVRRKTITEQIERLRDMQDEDMFELIEELTKDDAAYVGLRWHALTKQKEQDTCLYNYKRVCLALQRDKVDADTLDDDNECFFPSDHALLYKYLRL